MLERQMQDLRNGLMKHSPVPSVSAGSAPSEDGDGTSGFGSKDIMKLVKEEKVKLLQVNSRRNSGELQPEAVVQTVMQTDPQPPVTQTDPQPVVPFSRAAPPDLIGWSRSDEESQAEALRHIEILRRRGSQRSGGQVAEGELATERAMRQELEKQLAQERMKRDATQQQVLCLEYELDGKEGALQVAERQLEQRDAELLEAQHQLEGAPSTAPGTEVEDALRLMRIQLEDKDRQLELKETHIRQLLAVLNQHGSSVANAFAQEDRLSSTFSAFPTTNWNSARNSETHQRGGSEWHQRGLL